MKNFWFLILAVAMAVCFIAGGASSIYAQDDESDADMFILEEVIVTASKRVEDLQAVPRSMAVIGSDDMDIRSASSVADILDSTAGINIQGWQSQIFIRGVGPAGSMMNDAGSEPSVQFNVDGNLGLFSSETNPVQAAMNDVERIEVIRGPAGAINGRMAAAGTVNVITTDPDFDRLNAVVGVQAGNYDTIGINAATNIPLMLSGLELPSYLENLSFRVAARRDKHSEYIHNSDGEGVSGSQDFFTVRTKMKWQPIDSLNILAQFTASKDESNTDMNVGAIDQVQTFPGVSTPHPQDPWLNANGTAQTTDPDTQRQYTQSIEASWENQFGTLTGRYGKSWAPVECDSATDERGNVCYEGDIYQTEYELRMASYDSARIQWMGGAYMYHKKEYAGPDEQFDAIDEDATTINFTDFYGDENYFTQYGYDITSSDFDANDPTRSWAIPGVDLADQDSVVIVSNDATRPIDSYSIFGNISVPFFEDKHRFSLGLRKTIEEKKRVSVVGIFAFDDTNGGLPHFTYDPDNEQWECDNCYLVDSEEPYEMTTDDEPISYTLGWEYDWKPEALLYVNVNNGFKPGGISAEALPNVYYEPETLVNYAAGIRSRWFDNRLQINAEAYMMDYDDLQVSINSEAPVTYELNGTSYTQAYAFQSRVINIGQTYITGLDIDYDWLITTKDRLKGTVAVKEAEYGEKVYRLGAVGMPPGHPEYVSFKGHTMPMSPKFTFTANYSHRFTFGEMTVTPRFDAKYSDKYIVWPEWWWGAIGSEVWQPAYWKYDAFLSIAPTDGNWTLNAYIKNIDETVVRTVSFMFTHIEAPRTMGVGVTVRF